MWDMVVGYPRDVFARADREGEGDSIKDPVASLCRKGAGEPASRHGVLKCLQVYDPVLSYVQTGRWRDDFWLVPSA